MQRAKREMFERTILGGRADTTVTVKQKNGTRRARCGCAFVGVRVRVVNCLLLVARGVQFRPLKNVRTTWWLVYTSTLDDVQTCPWQNLVGAGKHGDDD